ncbi:MAG: gamma carbonic anhydrase family protein [Actinobacteria bacterium]|jgi:carbonic anhydrase/acetyltransferase-like protein (isoleucine patch superfamily)|nr:gamma carbonic anhydrase family protein [Actinomycetota bacterium]MBT3687496.1 gamma carbonic anhydrase family protein [Actinomycetota bacterium]MBT4038208.1 gamma carbonic anhydrase family protein [Actinomycetota bacterium]MBT4279099.1 gamma carbonic anhydrase family protein [Actinomycetota bacterium]MBT4344280.1 gamma carbonic anhydrase family protein [Actinomycetota bacterium]
MPLYAIGDIVPEVHPTAYVHPEAVLIGAVVLGPESSVWPHAVIRADENQIVIGARSSVQDNAVLHCTADLPTIVGDDVTLGHLCHLEGCTIEDQVVVGVGSVVLHEALVGRGSIVGANAVVRNGQVVPPLSMALGVPATVREGVMAEGANLENAEVYVERARLFASVLRRLD